MRIALDAMGGDFAPQPNIDGAISALQALPDLEIVLVGDVPTLEPLVAATGYAGGRLRLHAADGFIGMEEKPTEALRKKPNCSIAVCWQLMAAKEVEAVVSAGHTGAVVAAGLRTRLFLAGVKRPGIAVVLPTVKGKCVLMDVGANPAARPEHLLQYGTIGGIYARSMLGIEKPRIGLMNIGSEEGKGNDLVRDAQDLFAKSESLKQYDYIGNVEGRDIYEGNADVIVCEGFVGNVILKVSEGIVDMVMKVVGHTMVGALKEELPQAVHALKGLEKKYQYHESGGAPLLGVDGNCIICHGSSTARSIHNALRVACELQNRKLNEQIKREIALDTPMLGAL